LEVTRYRREKQLAYNREHGITPRSVKRSAQASLHVYDGTERGPEPLAVAEGADADVAAVIAELEEEMQEAAGKLEFERAAVIRDQINTLKSGDFKRAARPAASTSSKKRGGGARGPRSK
jgi:excinuclease ABC subunit B